MSVDKKSHTGWYKYLRAQAEKEELSLTESMALCLHNIQNHLFDVKVDTRAAKEAAEHSEGILGALDELVGGIAAAQGLPYSGSSKMREALDTQRDIERQKALEGGSS